MGSANLDVIEILSLELDGFLDQQSYEIVPNVHVMLIDNVFIGKHVPRPDRQNLPAAIVREISANRSVEGISDCCCCD